MSALPDELPGRTRPPVHPVRVVLALLVVAAAAVGLLPDLLGLDGRSPFAQLVAFRPTLLAGLVVLAVGATVAAGVRKRGWTLAVGLLAVAAVGTVMVAPRGLAGVTVPEPDAPTRPALTVLSFNTYEGQADVDALAALIRDTKPDLIALPESAGRFRDKLAPLVPDYRFSPSQERGRDVQGVTAAVRADLGDVAVAGGPLDGLPLRDGLGWRAGHPAVRRLPLRRPHPRCRAAVAQRPGDGRPLVRGPAVRPGDRRG